MEHDEAVRLQMTEQYLLDELSPEVREQFEDHFFDCRECAADVRAAVELVEHTKRVLAEETVRVTKPAAVWHGWSAFFRPTVAGPVLAMLLVVVAYQNLVTYPHLLQAVNRPQVLPYASVNIGTYGPGGAVIAAHPGEGFLLLLRIPMQDGYTSYTANLYDPNQKLEWTLTVPAGTAHDASRDASSPGSASKDQWAVRVPGANRQTGTYTVAVRGETHAGGSEEVGRGSFELQVQ